MKTIWSIAFDESIDNYRALDLSCAALGLMVPPINMEVAARARMLVHWDASMTKLCKDHGFRYCYTDFRTEYLRVILPAETYCTARHGDAV